MGLRHIAAAATLALACATLSAGPAQARPEVDQKARDGDHFPSSIATTVPAGGTSMITTPTIGKDVKALTVTVKAKNPTPLQSEDFANFNNTIGSLSKSKRLLVCTMMYETLLAPNAAYDDDEEYEIQVNTANFAGTVLLACLQMAGLLGPKVQGRRSAAAVEKCAQVRPSLPATVKKVNGGYSLTASGTSRKAKKPKLKVRCRYTGNKVSYTIRSAKKGVSLRKAIGGKKVMVGIKSPDDAATSVPVKVTFNTP